MECPRQLIANNPKITNYLQKKLEYEPNHCAQMYIPHVHITVLMLEAVLYKFSFINA